jgi:hypothetical protein
MRNVEQRATSRQNIQRGGAASHLLAVGSGRAETCS